MFENSQIAVDGLPSAEDVDWQLLHPKLAAAMRVRVALVLAGATIALVALTIQLGIPLLQAALAWTLFLGAAATALTWPGIDVPRRGYALRSHDILFRSGVIWRSVTAVPFNRIQHVETSSTPLDRRFGLSTLRLFTAGGSGADLKIDGLDRDLAERIRQDILAKAGTRIEHG